MRITLRLVILLVVAMLLASSSPAAAAEAEAEASKFEDLGVQITSMTLQGTTFAKHPSGRDLVCTVIRGEPAKLLVFDVRSGELLHRLALDDAHGAWNATTASDGSVYVGTDDEGKLFRWVPGASALADLGRVAKEQTFVWDVAAGADGEVFCGTYPGNRVIRYHPNDGFSDVGRGPVAPGEDYCRALSYDPASGHVFAGVGAKAHLIQLDPKTGEKKNILPPKYKDKKFAYGVDVVAGKLFVMLTDDAATIVIDLATREVEATIPCGLQIISPKSPYAEKVYFNSGGGGVSAYDLKTRRHERVDAIGNAPVIALHWLEFDSPDFPGATLVAMTSRGKLVRYHPGTGKSDSKQLAVPPESVPIQSIVAGPDGKIYSGGYLVGGFTTFDPKTGRHEQLGNAGQPEGMAAYSDRIYLGVYPRARLKVFDPSKPFDQQNPKQFEELDRFDQDRPFAVLGVEELGKVFFGTIADYGALGGALTVHDVERGTTHAYRNVVPDQGVTSLAYANGLIVGATTIAGGLGIEPKEKEAKLFLWDPAKNEKVFETVPVPGAKMISGLVVAPDGNVWGIGNGELVVFDVAARKVVARKRLFPKSAPDARAGWRDAMMAVHPNGNVYGTSGGRLFRIDPRTMEMTVLRRKRGSGLLAIDREGRVYFRDRTNLWRYTP